MATRTGIGFSDAGPQDRGVRVPLGTVTTGTLDPGLSTQIGAGPSNLPPISVSTTPIVGIGSPYSREDHAHQGVRSVGVANATNITTSSFYGDITITLSPTPTYTGLTVNGISTIRNTLNVQTPGGSNSFIFDPSTTNADGFVGLATFPTSSINGSALLTGSITGSKISLPGIASIIASGAGNNTANSFFRFAYAGNSYIDPKTSAQLSGLTPQSTSVLVGDPQAYQAYAIQIPSTVVSGTVGQNGPGLSLPNGVYDVTVYVRVSANTSSATAATFTVTTSTGTASITGSPAVAANALSTTSYFGYKFSITTAGSVTGLSINTLSGGLVDVFVSHISGIPVATTSSPGLFSTFLPNVIATSATISSVSATSLVAGSINTDDIQISAGGRIYIGASKTAATRQEWTASGFKTYAGDIANPTVALNPDGSFQLRSATTGTRINMHSAVGIELYSGTTRTFFANAVTGALSVSGDISGSTGTFSGSLSGATGTFSGSLSAATGTFSGNLSAAGGSFAGSLSAATGSLGLLSLTDQLTITGAGNISVGAGAFTVSAAGAVTATNISISGQSTFTGAINATSGSFSGPITSSATITGGTLQTGQPGSGARVVITASTADRINFYDSSGNNTYIQSQVGQLLMLAGGGAYGFAVFGTGECGITGTNIALHGTTQIDAGHSLIVNGGQISVTNTAGSYGLTTTANIQAQGGVLALNDGSITKNSGSGFSFNSSVSISSNLLVSGNQITLFDGTITKNSGTPFSFNSSLRPTLGIAGSGPRYVVCDGANILYYGNLVTASHREMKRDIVDVPDRTDAILSLRPVQFHYRKELLRDDEKDALYSGLLIDEVQSLEVFEDLLTYGADHQIPNGINYDRIAVLLIPIIRTLRDEVTHLRELVNAK